MQRRRRVRAAPSPFAFAFSGTDAEAMSGLGRTKIWELRKDGRLKTIVVDGKMLIEGDSLRKLMQAAGDVV
jgi:hypothetical protein